MASCERCGAQNPTGAELCQRCGQSLKPLETAIQTLNGGADSEKTVQVSDQLSKVVSTTDAKEPTTPTESVGTAEQTRGDSHNEHEGERVTPPIHTVPNVPSVFASAAPIDPRLILEVMPTLRYVAKKKQEVIGPILDDFHFIFVLHFLSDLIGFMEAFRMVGLSWERSHFLYKRYLYPYWDRIARQLEGHKADVMPLMQGDVLKTVVGNIIAESKSDGRKIIIVEDGGYVVPLVHRDFQNDIDRFQGAVEQTTKGLNEVLKVRPLKFPVLSVASAQVKREKESPQIAIAVWDNVRRLLWDRDLRNPTVLVVGYGSIGSHLADHLSRNGASVKVFDTEAERRDEAKKAGYTVADEMVELIQREPNLILIGATGKTSISRREILALENNSVLVSASSDQHEIGLLELRLLSDEPRPVIHPVTGEKTGDVYKIVKTRNEVTLVAEGFPVNFWNAESLPFHISQVALVPLYLSALALANRYSEIQVGEPNSEFVDRLVDEEDIYDEL